MSFATGHPVVKGICYNLSPSRSPGPRSERKEVARLLTAIPVEFAAGLRLRALVLACLLTGRRSTRARREGRSGP
jgi:hypothetical protein